MRALSIRQPWAELIASGKKRIEYRSWQRDFRGDLLIVASASRHDDDCADEKLVPGRLAYGAAVCVVDLWKVTGEEGEYSWHVRNPRRVEPVPVKGYASIYHVADEVIRFTSGSRASVILQPKPKKRAAATVPRLSGAPKVLIAARDARMVKRRAQSLRAVGCRVTSVRDGYAASLHLDAHPAACVLIDADVQGHSAWEVVTLMRKRSAHADTPVIFAGGGSVSKKENVSRVGRAASADEVARAVQIALSAE